MAGWREEAEGVGDSEPPAEQGANELLEPEIMS